MLPEFNGQQRSRQIHKRSPTLSEPRISKDMRLQYCSGDELPTCPELQIFIQRAEAPDMSLHSTNHSGFQGRTCLSTQENTSALTDLHKEDKTTSSKGCLGVGLCLFPSFCSSPFRKLLVKTSHVAKWVKSAQISLGLVRQRVMYSTGTSQKNDLLKLPVKWREPVAAK